MKIDNTSHRSSNHHPRTRKITSIILHTGEGTRSSDLDWLCNRSSQVSAHYYVCRDGTVYQLVDDNRCAWHAGVAEHNEEGIGIETEHKTGQDWPALQRQRLAELCRHLITTYRIRQDRILAHRWIAPGRKSDPSDWPDQELREWIAGLYETETAHLPRAPHWYRVPEGIRAVVRYQAHADGDRNTGAFLSPNSRVHISKWEGDWGQLTLGGFVHKSGVEAE
jgi:N-acetyl-anhydromuramyl-L-alanine amidase AmpD